MAGQLLIDRRGGTLVLTFSLFLLVEGFAMIADGLRLRSVRKRVEQTTAPSTAETPSAGTAAAAR